MSNLTVLGQQELPDFLQNAGVSSLTKQLAGKTGVKRIVPKNGIFRKMVGGEEMGKVKGSLKAIIVNAAPHVGRIFYAKMWTPEAEPTAPDCFSNDGRSPDAGSAEPQAERCDSCPQNIKGSGQGNSKACRYSRRLALVLEEDFGTSLEGEVYQMNLASKSLFGDSVGDNTFMFENYTKYLNNNGKSIDYVVTEIAFNEDNDNQSVLFTPTRFIVKNEFNVVSEAIKRPEVQSMVIMTPYQADVSGRAAAPVKATSISPPPVITAPTKRDAAKAVAVPAAKQDLDAVVKAWSDEE